MKERMILTRRRTITGVAVAGGVGAVGLWSGTQPALAVTLEEGNWRAEGDEITTHDGSIDAVKIDPEVTLEWRGFNDQTTDVNITIEIPGEDGILTGTDPIVLYNESVTLDGTSGTETFEFDPLDITEEEEINKEDFEADEDGSMNESDITLELTVDPDEEAVDPATGNDTFTVTVRNEPADGNASGSSTTTIESSEEV